MADPASKRLPIALIGPSPCSLARVNVDAWLSLDSTRLLHEKDEHWEILRSLLAEAGTAANLVTDAHLAALAISHGTVLVFCDNDFARFKGLRWENPLGR